MSELIKREDVRREIQAMFDGGAFSWQEGQELMDRISALPAVSPWHRVEEPPKKAGEYIVAYHPCWWDDVKTQVTKVGMDSFRGKASWAKRKRQRVTHWMEKPKPPKEDA